MKSKSIRSLLLAISLVPLILLTSCGGSSSSSGSSSSPVTSSWSSTPTPSSSQESNGSGGSSASSGASGVLTRLNANSNLKWVEDVANDLTGSNSLATYLSTKGDLCAVWVFANADAAKSALDSRTLTFPGQQIYNGEDPQTNLGIILVSPFSGADCEFTVAKVFGWGK